MSPEHKLQRMDRVARAFLAQRFAKAPVLQKEMVELWSWFLGAGLPNDDFFSEFTNGKRESFAQRTWEMLLARHLQSQGHAIICPNGGPDFLFEYRGARVWVEAVVPEPKGLPPEWLDPQFSGVRTFPHEEILLRWTTAIDAKCKKLHQYQTKRIVKPGDAYVIAVNGCQLSVFPETRGISQMPFGVEAVFPVGPLAYRLNAETHKIEDSFISERYHLINRNSAKVPTTSFLDAAYSGVSALIGCAATRCHGKPLDLHVVHNPRADVPLPLGALGGEDDEGMKHPMPRIRMVDGFNEGWIDFERQGEHRQGAVTLATVIAGLTGKGEAA